MPSSSSRVNALGASEAVVQLQGTDQILVQIPGLSDTEDGSVHHRQNRQAGVRAPGLASPTMT